MIRGSRGERTLDGEMAFAIYVFEMGDLGPPGHVCGGWGG